MLTKHLDKKDNALALLTLFCVTLILLRVQYTQTLTFKFLLWNLFLAIIPYVITRGIQKFEFTGTKLFLFIGLWLLFLPNSPYIITDLIHLKHSKSSLLWYDIFMIFSFANTGLLFAVLSMKTIYTMIKEEYTSGIAHKFIAAVSILTGFGVYLGRFLRLNSWDVFTNPFDVFEKCFSSLNNSSSWFVTIGFASLLWVLFSIFESFSTKDEVLLHKKSAANIV